MSIMCSENKSISSGYDCRWCPDSLRWLAAKGEYEAVRAILEKAATFNHVTLPTDVLSDLTDDTEGTPDAVTVSIWNMLKSPRPRRYMLIMLFLMLVSKSCGDDDDN